MLQPQESYLSAFPWLLREPLPMMPLRVVKRPWREIAREVAERHGITLEHLVSHRDRQRLAPARQEAWALIYAEGRLSYPQIGALFDGRDHTTILCGVRRHYKGLE